jgi:hypothetical protein
MGCSTGISIEAGCQATGAFQDLAVGSGVIVAQGVGEGRGVAVEIAVGVAMEVGDAGIVGGTEVAVGSWALACCTSAPGVLQPDINPDSPTVVNSNLVCVFVKKLFFFI